MDKKTILFHSNHSKSKTGFGRHCKAVLKYLYSTGKYRVVEFATGANFNNPELETMPWECKGSLPDSQAEWQQILAGLNLHDQEIKKRAVNYGDYHIDKMIKDYKPDIYIGTEDIWAFNGYFDRPWWNKVNCMIHTTIDSLPILPDAINAAEHIKNYYVWSKFAEDALHELGHNHVKTLHGAIETKQFFPFKPEEKLLLRKRLNLAPDAFIIGFVFRNQLRKSVVKLLQAFKMFCNQNPQSNAYLLLHTHWSEARGWNIPARMKEIGIDPNRVLTTFYCRACKRYEIKPFELPAEEWKKTSIDTSKGQNKDCPICRTRKSQTTVTISEGVNEHQLNEIYNLMDVYCHPFTSGGQEIPIQEAKLTELITLATDYSCGKEYCTAKSGGLPIEWEEYREPGTEFIKSASSVRSIVKGLKKVSKMTAAQRGKEGKKARKYVLENMSEEVIGKELERIIDTMPLVEWDWNFDKPTLQPDYAPPEVEDNEVWLRSLYNNILLFKDIKKDDKGLLYWIGELKKGKPRGEILSYFRGVAMQENQKNKKTEVSKFFDDTGNKKILLVIKESLGDCFMVTALFESLKRQYPDHDLYVSTEYPDVFMGNRHVYKTIPFHPTFENELLMTGQAARKPIVDVFLLPTISTQKMLNYLSNENLAFNLELDEMKGAS